MGRAVTGIGIAAAAAALAAGLAGCGERTRQAIGLDRQAPDEFAVVTRAPLSVPPDFNLRPPVPGAPRPQEPEVTEQAREILRDAAGAARSAGADAPSAGERALLGRAGAADADPAVRDAVDAESERIAESRRSFVDSLVFWRDPEPPGDAIDPQAEAERLRGEDAAGKPPAGGAAPVIERR